ncbi:RICIN domain-containing protein [Streptomyces sp. NPDC007808]|uniref:RICIN domain-containing protein n=1 Tax=Streptomyces sp. NPDC007808 TaxID=3364779 RepID=UPI0036D0C3CD
MTSRDDIYVAENPSTRREPAQPTQGRTIHRFGRLNIVAEVDHQAPAADLPSASDLGKTVTDLAEIEQVGLAALQLRESDDFRAVKSARPRAGERWDMPGCTTVVPTPTAATHPGAAAFAPPTSAYLEGSVAVGIVIVEGPTDALRFSEAERTKVVAEVQSGLGWLASVNPSAGVSFAYDIQHVTLDAQADPDAPDLEAHWRDPAMSALGYDANWNGVLAYVEAIRSRLGTRWTYCGFFTKYPLPAPFFAYASIGGPRLVMHYDNDGWGPDNIDRVFAHETGHIFGCPDEYASSNCNCGGRWGRFGVNNGNCANCSSGGGTACIMKANDFSYCEYTASHLGWSVVTPLFAKHSGKVLDVSGVSPDNGAPVIQWDWWGGDNQRWRLEAVGDGYVRAVAQHSGKVLDVSGISPDNGAPVIQWDWWGGDNQRWRFESVADGVHQLTAKHSGKVLDVSGISPDNGAPVIQWDWWGGDNQRWEYQFQPLFVKHSGKALDVSDISLDLGAPLIQWAWWSGDNQHWRLEPVGDGYVRIIAKHSGKVLDIEGASQDNGARVIQWDWWGGDNQRFRVESVENGYVKLTAKHSNKVLDVFGASGDDGAPIIQWDWTGGDNQRWRC